MIRHHPSEAMLLAHTAGTLPEPQRIVMRTHLALCPECGGSAHLAADVCGALLDDLAPAALAPEALDRTLARLDLQDIPAARAHIPTTVEELAKGRWWRLAPGLRFMPLRSRDARDTRLDLLEVAPGVGMPAHGHSGTELTIVLSGRFRDETGEYGTGDLAEGDADLHHQPIALPGEPCVCLIATSGRLRADRWLPRMFQSLLGL